MNVNPGALSKRIKIIEKRSTKDEDGFLTYEDFEVLSCWAQKSQTSGKELFEAGKDFTESKTRFLIRYPKTTLKETMFILYDNKKYNIQYLHNYADSNEYMEIFCGLIEGASNG